MGPPRQFSFSLFFGGSGGFADVVGKRVFSVVVFGGGEGRGESITDEELDHGFVFEFPAPEEALEAVLLGDGVQG